jgi:hypothetical protein
VRYLGWILLGLVAMLLAAGLRGAVEQLVRAVLGLPVAVLDAARDGAGAARRYLVEIGRQGRRSLAYGEKTDSAGGWDLVAPLLYLVLFAVIAFGDLVLAGLRFGALLGIPIDGLPVDGTTLDLLTGLLFLAVLTTYGCVLLDVARVTPLHRPYGLVGGGTQKAVLGLASAGVALSGLAAVLFFVWGQYAVLGEPSADAATLFVAVFALLLVGASILAAGGAIGAVPALWVLLCGLLAAVLAVGGWVCTAAIAGLNGVHRLVVAAVRLLARPGAIVWNWLVGPRGALRMSRLPEPGPVDDLLAPRQGQLDLAAGEGR